MKLSDLKVGDKVKGECNEDTYEGEVMCIHDNRACIKRDDKKDGGGCSDYWEVTEWGGAMYSDEYKGKPLQFIKKLKKEPTLSEIIHSWADKLEKELQEYIKPITKHP